MVFIFVLIFPPQNYLYNGKLYNKIRQDNTQNICSCIPKRFGSGKRITYLFTYVFYVHQKLWRFSEIRSWVEHALKAYEIRLSYAPRKGILATLPNALCFKARPYDLTWLLLTNYYTTQTWLDWLIHYHGTPKIHLGKQCNRYGDCKAGIIACYCFNSSDVFMYYNHLQ